MRSTRKAILVASTVVSSSLAGMGMSSALAQGFGAMPNAPLMPVGIPAVDNPTVPSGNPYSVKPAISSAGFSQSIATPRPVYASPGGAAGATTSPYGNHWSPSPAAAPGSPTSPDAVRTSYASPAAGYPGAPSPNPPGYAAPSGAPRPAPVATNGATAADPHIKPYLATVPSPADAPKPRGLRRIFSFLRHGGSSSDDEKKHAVYDYSTGRTDLPNARPWMSQPSK